MELKTRFANHQWPFNLPDVLLKLHYIVKYEPELIHPGSTWYGVFKLLESLDYSDTQRRSPKPFGTGVTGLLQWGPTVSRWLTGVLTC